MEALSPRFWSNVSKLPDAPGCWLWTGYVTANGYGATYQRVRTVYAHRASLASHLGVAYEALEHAHHTCRVRSCVNPHHLETMTIEAHVQRHLDEKDRELCRRGHSMADAYVRRDKGTRQCRTCIRRRLLKGAAGRSERKKAARARRVREPRACAICGRLFVPTRRNHLACGKRCAWATFYRRHK